MKKNLKSNSGYAMTELLIAAVVILGIFSLLFSNFLPLAAEYESREIYNNPTSKYAAYYLRKMYINALKSKTNGVDRKVVLNENIAKNNYYKVYDKKENKLCDSILLEDKPFCESILKQYNIEEVIITNYKVQDLKKSYPKNNTFSNYIAHLPVYKDKTENGKELYRIILKTKDYGYATTEILSDYRTNSKCFVGKIKSNEELEVTDYLYDDKECSDKVVIANDRVTIKDKSGNNISGIITKIGDEAFMNKSITEISYGTSITEIGNKAFKNTKLDSFKFNSTLNIIGDEAFKNTNIEEIFIPNNVTFGDYAFENNTNLTKIELETGIKYIINKNGNITEGLFKNCGNNKEVTLKLPSTIQYIGKSTYENTYVKELDFGNIPLKVIDENAFKTFKEKKTNNFSLPNTLEEINDYAFYNNDINILVIPKNVKTIGSYAFTNSSINKLTFDPEKKLVLKSYSFKNNKDLKELEIPNGIDKIEKGAFLECSVGKKEKALKTYKTGLNWCSILYDKTNCKTSNEQSILKINLGSDTRYIEEIDNDLGGATLD